ncbi:MAG: nucleotidyltransferase domain-containing protein [Planctomycetota bacterium]|nr:nucleotidyltransferase domain-containing protein [Planctomycetota bacterium]
MSRSTPKPDSHSVAEWSQLRLRVTESLLAGIVQRIVEKFRAEKIILFGSYAKGVPNRDSDVDLLVVMDSKEPLSQRIRRVTEVAKVRFLPMDIIVRTPAEIDERLAIGDFFIADILSTGKVLYQRDAR